MCSLVFSRDGMRCGCSPRPARSLADFVSCWISSLGFGVCLTQEEPLKGSIRDPFKEPLKGTLIDPLKETFRGAPLKPEAALKTFAGGDGSSLRQLAASGGHPGDGFRGLGRL